MSNKKQVKKALPRNQRTSPQAPLVFSTNFIGNMLAHDKKCFVTLQDYAKLEKRYLQLFKRYKRNKK